MKIVDARTRDFFDRHVVAQITGKYGIDDLVALHRFIDSETYQMLTDSQAEVYVLSPNAVFDMWESEQVTGDPRNSQYIRL